MTQIRTVRVRLIRTKETSFPIVTRIACLSRPRLIVVRTLIEILFPLVYYLVKSLSCALRIRMPYTRIKIVRWLLTLANCFLAMISRGVRIVPLARTALVTLISRFRVLLAALLKRMALNVLVLALVRPIILATAVLNH